MTFPSGKVQTTKTRTKSSQRVRRSSIQSWPCCCYNCTTPSVVYLLVENTSIFFNLCLFTSVRVIINEAIFGRMFQSAARIKNIQVWLWKGHRAFLVTHVILKSGDQVGEMTSLISSDLRRRRLMVPRLPCTEREHLRDGRRGRKI